jgi:hypothetical protein
LPDGITAISYPRWQLSPGPLLYKDNNYQIV